MTPTNRAFHRRQFLRGALATAGAAAALPAFQGLNLFGRHGRVLAADGSGGYGPLMPVADERDGAMRMSLPDGFKYRSFSVTGDLMSDGNLVPLALDGMGVFNTRDGRFRLVRNHEDRNGPGLGTVAVDGNAYDKKGGGTTTLVVNPFTRALERDFISLSGTTVNCAGGVTPWHSWITCEETNVGPTPAGWQKQHGYCFDVPADADGTVPAIAVPEMGRFSHEAIAVDPGTWIVYETEDNGSSGGSSGFYRFLPNTPGVLVDGGRLQMLAIDGAHGRRADLRLRTQPRNRPRMGGRDVRRGRSLVERPEGGGRPSAGGQPVGARHAVCQSPGCNEWHCPDGAGTGRTDVRDLGAVAERRALEFPLLLY